MINFGHSQFISLLLCHFLNWITGEGTDFLERIEILAQPTVQQEEA